MRNFLLGLMLLTSLSAVAGEINVKVNGLVCSMCAQGIQKKFKDQTEVKGITVNLDEKLVNIQTTDGAKITDKTLTTLIQEAGYNVVKIERK